MGNTEFDKLMATIDDFFKQNRFDNNLTLALAALLKE